MTSGAARTHAEGSYLEGGHGGSAGAAMVMETWRGGAGFDRITCVHSCSQGGLAEKALGDILHHVSGASNIDVFNIIPLLNVLSRCCVPVLRSP